MNDPMNPHQRNDSRNNLFHSSGYGDTIIARDDDEQAKSGKYYVRHKTGDVKPVESRYLYVGDLLDWPLNGF